MPEDVLQRPRGLVDADTLGYLLALSRPRFWLYLAGPVLVGAAFGARGLADLSALAVLALALYFLAPGNLFLYAVNDVFDRDVDAANPKKTGADARETRYQGQSVVFWAVAASVALLFPVLAVVPMVAWPWLAAWLFLATNYSAPPFRFKTTPVLDSLSNGLYVLPGVAAYAALAGTNPPALAVLGAWLWTMGMHTFSAIPDILPDRHSGIQTTATWLGATRAYWYCATVWGLAVLAFGALDWRLAAPLAIYPVLALGVRYSNLGVERAYWWFPAINTVVGATFTVGGLWRLVYG
jgi:4-hydroxybenzoate polyprenyltransferase